MSVVERPRRTVVNGLVALGVLAGFVGLLVAGPGVHVVARGHFVDYTEHEVLRARIFDSFSVLAAPETRANTDLMNVIVLCLLAGTAVLAAVLSPKGRMRWFFAIAAAGAFLASLEEGFELSETLGYNLGGSPTTGSQFARSTSSMHYLLPCSSGLFAISSSPRPRRSGFSCSVRSCFSARWCSRSSR